MLEEKALHPAVTLAADHHRVVVQGGAYEGMA